MTPTTPGTRSNSDWTEPALASTYEPGQVEKRLYQWWESSGFFAGDPESSGEPFAIAMPPPNVNGRLHMGHALTIAVEDALIRWARMSGKCTVWLPGIDHAGIAVQNAVEKDLASEGLTRHDLGREKFLERVWKWKDDYGGYILSQIRTLGASCDWNREAFTLDAARSKAVREVFCKLFDEGLIYRGLRLINWDPVNGTALSDIEVDHEEVEGELAYLRYPASDGGEGVVVATTRPETMLGDTAVAVHPDDPRYAHLIGRTLTLPLMNRELPVVADAHVDPEFGTGAVKVTPAHDPNDYEIGLRHDLQMLDVMTDQGTMSEAAGQYAGLDRFDARAKVTQDLQALGLLVKVEPHTHPVGVSSRSGGVVEPRLSEQWFVSTRPLADAAAQAVRDGRTRFVPERNTKGFLDWLDNLHDWTISRQLWWGHRIPVWYDRDGNQYALREDPSAEEVERLGLEQDPDVLDTWFSSQLWPFTTLGWTGFDEEPNPELQRWYPNQVMETGYDINTFWVSRMLMIGLHVIGEVPFEVVYNHGMVRDGHGKKMSKSFGNVIDPVDFIDRYGADALRFALLRASSPGVDVPIAEEWVEGARRFANKLWNAARFTLIQCQGQAPDEPPSEPLHLEDRWILSRLEATRQEVAENYAAYDLSRVAKSLYHFIWDEFCDWYLELAKLRDDQSARVTLAYVLDCALRLLHPLMPFVTEEIWQALHNADQRKTLMLAEWPQPAPQRVDALAEGQMNAVFETVTALRRFRAEHGFSPKVPMTVAAMAADADAERLKGGLGGIQRLANVASWSFVSATDAPAGPVGKIPVAGAELLVPLEGLIDLDEERSRLRKELDKALAERERAERKLANEGFVAKAPDHVVEAERAKVAEWTAMIRTLETQLDDLG